jgi:hypothetical protein
MLSCHSASASEEKSESVESRSEAEVVSEGSEAISSSSVEVV